MTRSRARAYWAVGPGRGEIRETPLDPPGADQVLVETLYTGVSRGTEALVAAGRVPESERERMRCPFQGGEFPFPVKYGYSAVGRVIDGDRALAGRLVFVLHPHQDRFVVPAAAALPLADGLPPGRAVLAANMETAVNGIWDAGIGPGERVGVIGAGVVGLLVAWMAARIPGTAVTIIDPDNRKRAAAEALGLAFSLNREGIGDCDVVFHASGTPAGLADALTIAGFEATIVEMSWYGDALVPLALGGAFHARRLTLRSSQVGTVAPRQRPRWSHRRRLALALRLLADPVLDALITGETRFETLPEEMPRIVGGAEAILCRRIVYGRKG